MKRLLILLFVIPCFTFLAAGQKELTLEKVWASAELRAKTVPGFNFMKDGIHYSRKTKTGVESYDLRTGEQSEVLFNTADFIKGGTIDGYSFNSTESKMLIYMNKASIYRYSFTADFALYDREEKNIKPLGNGQMMVPVLSHDDQYVAYVQDNNIYYQDLATGNITPVTTDGVKNEIINGVTDWVYEEEFSFTRAFHWSPDAKHIAFLRFDEREVPEFTMMNYRNDLYPEYQTFKYPKVGEKNSVVSLHLYNSETNSVHEIELPQREDDYIARIQWSDHDGHLYITWLNRHQNHLKLYRYDPGQDKISLFLEEKSQYYIDVQDKLLFTPDGSKLIWQSELGSYNHLYTYDLKDGKKKQLTTGDWDVTNVYGIDEKANTLYFQAAKTGPLHRQIMSVSLRNGKVKTVQDQPGDNSATYSGDMSYYVHQHSNANQAPTYVVKDRKHNVVRIIENNGAYPELMTSYGARPVEFFSIHTEDSVSLNAWRITPPQFDENKKYPVLMYVYGGPGSQTVRNRWSVSNYWYFQYLAQQGYIVVSVDNRGTGARGETFKKMTYLQLGKYETIDQINAAKYLAQQSYVDEDKIGIFGWSYGGYMSSLCILKGKDVFNAAVAVAPVTSWKWYDTIYTERYMRTEEENPSGYADNSPVYFAGELEDAYMIVHGLGDDNVHFQHTAEMVEALVNNNKDFTSYFYPNRNHGIYGGYTRLHLFRAITEFLNENLRDQPSVKP